MASPPVTSDTAAPAAATAPTDSPRVAPRIASLDQFRGWAIFSMVLVNFLGEYRSMPETMRHHEWGLSFADVVVPAFLFAVGVAYRLTFLRRMRRDGIWAARRAALKRNVLLLLVAFFLYGTVYFIERGVVPGLLRLCQSILGQIALASLLALPFIERGPVVRLVMALVYCGGFQAVYQRTGYGAWMQGNGYDSGPLGALNRVCPLLMGTVIYDLLAQPDRKRLLGGAVALGVGAILAGYGLSLIWGFSKPFDAVPYVIFMAGICALVQLGFHQLADRARISIPTFTAVGRNALAIYVVQDFMLDRHMLPRETPALIALAVFLVLYLALYVVARYLDRHGYYIRL